MDQTHITNVFKNDNITKEEYTRVWIDLINRLEKSKCAIFSPKM